MNLHAKFQPSSFKTLGGDSRDRHAHGRHTLLDAIPFEISKLSLEG